jgi:hypothetical protein
VTRPPPYPPPGVPSVGEEELDELGDDAIVAQQAVHAPQPRVQVEMESRTIVVAEEDPFAIDPSEVMETRQLPSYSAASDLTPIAQRTAARAPTMVLRRVPLRTPKQQRNWLVIGIWIAAGVVAFGFGGILAALTARGTDAAPSATIEPPAITVEPAPPPAVAAAPQATPAEPAVEPSEPLTAHQLPVEEPPATVRPRSRPRAAPAPTSDAPTPTSVPANSDIPEGI